MHSLSAFMEIWDMQNWGKNTFTSIIRKTAVKDNLRYHVFLMQPIGEKTQHFLLEKVELLSRKMRKRRQELNLLPGSMN